MIEENKNKRNVKKRVGKETKKGSEHGRQEVIEIRKNGD